MQFTDVPPTLKPPLTVAFAIGKLFESVTVAMTLARHVPNFETITEEPVNWLILTIEVGVVG